MSIYNSATNDLDSKPLLNADWQPVTSSVLKAVRYNPELRKLDIAFASGRAYRYSNISQEMFDELMRAESKGHWFNTALRPFPQVYPGVELEQSTSASASTSNAFGVNVQRLSHAFNLEGDLFTLSLPGLDDDEQEQAQVLVVQSTHYCIESPMPQSVQSTPLSPSVAALLGFEQAEEEGEPSQQVSGPTAVCLYSLSGEPFATLSVRVPQSTELPQDIFYVKSYGENTSLFLLLVKCRVLLTVEGYPAAPVGYVGVVHTYRLNPDLFQAEAEADKPTRNHSRDA